MKAEIVVIMILTSILSSEVHASAPEFPKYNITPSRIVTGDSVTLRIFKGEHSNTCVPYYEVAYTITQEPEEIFPPNYTIILSYTEIPTGGSSFCGSAITAYGPTFTFTDLAEGNYTFKSDIISGSFRVFENDSVDYKIITEKNMYTLHRNPDGENLIPQNLDVLYAVVNKSQKAVRYIFTSSCQFDMTIQNMNDSTIYWYMDNRGCDDAITAITLAPGDSFGFAFPSFTLTEMYGPCKLSAGMIGYDKSYVSSWITVNMTTKVNGSNLSEKDGPYVSLTHTNGILTLKLNRTRKISLEMYAINGELVHQVSSGHILEAGTYSFTLKNRLSSYGVYLLRIKGNDIDEAMLINMMAN